MPFKVCYSFWALSALSILQHLNWIDSDKLIKFILSAQDEQGGGIADRPGDMVDVFHTLFGLAGEHDVEYPYFSISLSAAGLSLVGFPGLNDLDPVYCMPVHLIEERGLRKQWKALPRRT